MHNISTYSQFAIRQFVHNQWIYNNIEHTSLEPQQNDYEQGIVSWFKLSQACLRNI